MSSLRPDGGLLGGIATTVWISIPQWILLPVYIDNQALITCIGKQKHSSPSGKFCTDFDLLQVIIKLSNRNNFDLIPEHVKAHQDNDCAYVDLSWKAKLNCNCNQQVSQWCGPAKDVLAP
jgi:hypothetical protein